MHEWLLVLLLIVAVHRLTRLAVADEIPLVKVPRDTIVDWLDPVGAAGQPPKPPLGGFGRSIAYLLTCPWCMSMWVGGALVWATTWWVSVPVPLLVWLAASSVTGWAASAESEHEQRHELAQRQIDTPGVAR